MALLLALTAPLASFPASAVAEGAAPPRPREHSEALLVKGDAAAERGDFDSAISYYRPAYYSLSAPDRASYLGSIPIRKAMAAFEQGVAQAQDPAKRRQLLESQRTLLTRFLSEVRARDGAAEEIGEDVIAELVGTLRALDEALGAEQQGIGVQDAQALAPTSPATPETIESADGAVEDDEGLGDGKLRWGWMRPQPQWKWAAFGVSASLLVASAAATIGTSVWLSSETGGYRRRLLDAAQASLTDANEINDVDPNVPEGVNLCEFAKSRPTDENGMVLGMPGQVRNSAVVKICKNGESIHTGQIAAGAATAVFGVTTLVFTGLLLIHKRKPGANAMLRHGVRMGVGPGYQGGLTFGGGLRF